MCASIRDGKTSLTHTSTVQSGSIRHLSKQPAFAGIINELSHCQGILREHVLKAAGNEPTDTLCVAAVVAKGIFIEIGLQVLRSDGAIVGSKQPSLQARTQDQWHC